MADIDAYRPNTISDPDSWHVRVRLTRRDLQAMDAEDLERIMQSVRALITGLVGEARPPRYPPAPGQRYDAEATAIDDADDADDPGGGAPPATILLDGPLADLEALEREDQRLERQHPIYGRHP